MTIICFIILLINYLQVFEPFDNRTCMDDVEKLYVTGLVQFIPGIGRGTNTSVDDCISIALKIYFGECFLPGTAKDWISTSETMHQKTQDRLNKDDQKDFSKFKVSNFFYI